MPAVDPEKLPEDVITAPVVRGMLEDVLAERGLVDSVENIVVASECEWTRRIERLVPEGEWVEKGDVVVVLDSSELEERLQKREIRIINAEAELEHARQTLQITRLENRSAQAQAKLTKQLAELDLEKYVQGEFPKQRNEAAAAVALAEQDVKRAKERYEYVERMVRKGYESPMEAEEQRLSLLENEQALANARHALHVLVTYDRPRQLAELKSTAREAERALARIDEQAELDLVNLKVLVENRETQLQQHRNFAERLRTSIAACTIRAPKSGEIIYANEGRIRNEIVEGEWVRHRQEVVRIPNLEELQVEIRIHESEMTGMKTGLEATISIDAFPGLTYRGEVSSVSAVPTSGSRYRRDLKEYDATVRIDATPDEMEPLKPGLTAHVDIHVRQRDDCLFVPPQSIVNVAGHAIVFVRTEEAVEHREIELGMATDTGVEVVSGLQEGEHILLSPRTHCSETIEALTDYYARDVRVENIDG